MTSYDEFIASAASTAARRKGDIWTEIADPTLFHLVREGSERFGRPPDAVWDDIDAAVRRAQSPAALAWARFAERAENRLENVARYCYFATLGRWHKRRFLDQRTILRPDRSKDRHEHEPEPEDKISIVMLSFNRKEYLSTAIDFFHLTMDYPNHEFIVVDNGSTDGSRELLADLADRGRVHRVILRSRNHGISKGFNLGFAAADPSSSFYVKLDSDICILSVGWAREAMRILRRNPRIGLLGLLEVNHPDLQRLPSRRVGDAELVDWADFACGSCMVIPRRTLDEIGRFNEDFAATYVPDDVDYFARLVRAGREVYYAKRLLTYHQMHLDRTTYRSYERSKDRRNFLRVAAEHARRYDRGLAPLRRVYPHYDELPRSDARVVEVE